MSMRMDPADGSQSSIANGNITMPPLIDGSDDINPVDGNTTSSPENCTERLGTIEDIPNKDLPNDAIDGNGGCIDDETGGGGGTPLPPTTPPGTGTGGGGGTPLPPTTPPGTGTGGGGGTPTTTGSGGTTTGSYTGNKCPQGSITYIFNWMCSCG